MGVLAKILSWLRPPADPEAEAEAARLRSQVETIRTSQLSSSGASNLPPTQDVTDPGRR